MSDGTLLIILISLPFIGSIVATLLPENARNAQVWLAGGIALIGLLMVVLVYPAVSESGVIRTEIRWLPVDFKLNFILRMDGLAWLFCVMVTCIGFLVMLYARYYMSAEDPIPRFFSFFLAFMGAMLGIVLSGNLVQLVFFWELTSLTSFLLISYWHHNANARKGARMALTVTAAGGLCLFAGVIIIGYIVGSYDLDWVLSQGDLIRAHPLYPVVLILFLLGALTKSAQFPFHFWLPQAMAAPTPVSAYLHSATMVKAGVFLMVRLSPVLGGTDMWFWIVSTSGVITLLLGAYTAIFQRDLKGLLAYSTISHLGLITLLIGFNSPTATVAAIFHIINHATFKASLFMAVGIIDHETGTRDIRRLSGLLRLMPITASLAMVASAAMAGVPLLNGFLSKEMFFAEALSASTPFQFTHDVLPVMATVAGVFSVAYSLRFIHGVFFGPPAKDLSCVPHEPPHWMRFPVECLVLICLVVGIIPTYTIGPVLGAAVHAVLGSNTPEYSLSIWHGFTLPLLMSVIAMTCGVVLYILLQGYLRRNIDGPPLTSGIASQQLFDRALVTLSWRMAKSAGEFLGTRRLQPQMRLLVYVTVLAAACPLVARGLSIGEFISHVAIDPAFAIMWAIGISCAVGAAYQAKYHRLAALILLGGTGLITCITFIWFSAPDLALTQLLVEVVTTVLILLGLRWLPKRVEDHGDSKAGLMPVRRLRDLTIAIVSGVGLSVLAYAIMARPTPNSIARYFLENAYTEGGGTNVVNVILVDFRGFDTMGEITVLGIVALTVYALLRRFRPDPESIDIPEQQQIQNAFDTSREGGKKGDTLSESLLIPGLIMRLLFPVIGMLAVYLFMRGHNLPGGGFVAGLTMAVAFILQYMVGGTRWVEARLRILPLRWIGAGLLLAVGTGTAALFFGYPFLTSAAIHVPVPLIGDLHLNSAFVFDLGVFLLVVGATVLILIALAHQSIRSHRASRPAEE